MNVPDEQTGAADPLIIRMITEGVQRGYATAVADMKTKGWLSPVEVAVLRAGWESTAAADALDRLARSGGFSRSIALVYAAALRAAGEEPTP